VNEELEPAEAEIVVKQLPSHKNKETCICIEKRIINTNTAQITALDSSNNTLDALPATWTWKNISELRHQATLYRTQPNTQTHKKHNHLQSEGDASYF
jgi:hypothetical protein